MKFRYRTRSNLIARKTIQQKCLWIPHHPDIWICPTVSPGTETNNGLKAWKEGNTWCALTLTMGKYGFSPQKDWASISMWTTNTTMRRFNEIRYLPMHSRVTGSKKVELELECNNLFNAKNYMAISKTNMSTFISRYELRPVSALLKVRFKLKWRGLHFIYMGVIP